MSNNSENNTQSNQDDNQAKVEYITHTSVTFPAIVKSFGKGENGYLYAVVSILSGQTKDKKQNFISGILSIGNNTKPIVKKLLGVDEFIEINSRANLTIGDMDTDINEYEHEGKVVSEAQITGFLNGITFGKAD